MLHIIANAQRNGGLAAFIDAEHALDRSTPANRVNLDDLLVSQPDSGQALRLPWRSNALDVIDIDSVAALREAELQGEMGMATMGMQARLMSSGEEAAILSKAKTTACSRTRSGKVGDMFGTKPRPAARRSSSTPASASTSDGRSEGRCRRAVGNHVRSRSSKTRSLPLLRSRVRHPFQHRQGRGIPTGIDNGVVDKEGGLANSRAGS